VKIGIIGGTGYTGIELLRILIGHPVAEVVCVTSRNEEGKQIADLFSSLRGYYDLCFSDTKKSCLNECEVVFCATPNGVAMHHAPALLDKDIKIVDLSADFRIKDVTVWETWYGMEHVSPDLIKEAVYGLPEVNRHAIKGASLVANPGCYPTAVQLGFLPLLESDLVDVSYLIADAKSGVSGAGRKVSQEMAFSEMADSFKAYSVSGHRHLPEIKQGLQEQTNQPVGLLFTPHLLPIIRGIHATLYARLKNEHWHLSDEVLQSIYETRFKNERFVDVMPFGSHPDTMSVRGGNHCRIAVHRPQKGNSVVVLSVEDNLVKGAVGQAIQNMNLMMGLEETMGLDICPIVP